MNFDLAVIGGVGYALEGLADEVETPYGKVPIVRSRMKGQKIVFISRHGDGRDGHLPPHKVNYRAIISAAKISGASTIISTNTVGSMAGHPMGSIFLPSDFVEFTKCRPNTFFEDKAVHVDMSRPYCPRLRASLAEAARSLGQTGRRGRLRLRRGPAPGVACPDQDDAPVRGCGGHDRLSRGSPGQRGAALLCIALHRHQSRRRNGGRKRSGHLRDRRYYEKVAGDCWGDNLSGCAKNS